MHANASIAGAGARDFPVIEGPIKDSKCVTGGTPFTNLDHLIDNSMFTPDSPDRCYGARHEQINRQIRIDLSNQIIPSIEDDVPITPNFFLAVKNTDESLIVAEQQACYYGSLGARGIHSLQSYK